MEEDLKKIEYFLDLVDETIDKNIEVEEIEIKELKQSIENLIKGYKELEEELRPIKNIEKALDEMDIEGMWNDIKAEDYIPKSKIREVLQDKIWARQFDLQQEYKDFKDDVVLNTIQDIKDALLQEGDDK